MATFTNTTKNIATFTNTTKNIATFLDHPFSHTLAYITTDTPDYVLVGLSEDEVLLWDTPISYTNLIKS